MPPVMSHAGGLPRGLILITVRREPEDDDDRRDDRSHQPHSPDPHRAVEDPIEVVHDDQLSIVQQREIGIDTESYAAAPGTHRQDPT